MTSAVILAGGLGTRLRSVVPDLPKPMAPINGKPFLVHQMRYWVSQGIDHFVLSVGYRYQSIINYFGTQFEGTCIEYAIEESPLGTGGGLLLASKKVSQKESFLLLNGDTYFEIELKNLMDFSEHTDADWCFSLFKTNELGRYLGMSILPDGQIDTLQEDSSSKDRFANGGVYLVNPSALSSLSLLSGHRVSLEEDIFPVAIALGQRFFAKEFQNTFIDIGVPDDYQRASTLLIKRKGASECN
jgi:D-glycero-alpha-D-manno-heptose 1-phosphate guanylyltransferase